MSAESSSSSTITHSIEKLDGSNSSNTSNYNAWKFPITRLLKAKSVWDVISNPCHKQTPAPDESSNTTATSPGKDNESSKEYLQWKAKDNKAFTIISLTVRDSQIGHIQTCETAADAWTILKEIHQGIGSNGRMVLTQRLTSIRFHEGSSGSMQKHIDQFRAIKDQLQELGKELNDADLVNYVMICLFRSYSPLIMTFNALRNETRTFDFIAIRLLQEEARRMTDIEGGRSGLVQTSTFSQQGPGQGMEDSEGAQEMLVSTMGSARGQGSATTAASTGIENANATADQQINNEPATSVHQIVQMGLLTATDFKGGSPTRKEQMEASTDRHSAMQIIKGPRAEL